MKRLLALTLLAGPAFADPIAGKGYALGCDEGVCSVFFQGVVLDVAPDNTPKDVYDRFAAMEPLTPVILAGRTVDLGDASGDADLTSIAVDPTDTMAPVLRQVQGRWQGADLLVWIDGLVWTEGADADGAMFSISPAEACAGGQNGGLLALSLYAMGGDPAEAQCWAVEAVTDKTLTLTDLTGGAGQVVLQKAD